jgi:hypothetical protein
MPYAPMAVMKRKISNICFADAHSNPNMDSLRIHTKSTHKHGSSSNDNRTESLSYKMVLKFQLF